MKCRGVEAFELDSIQRLRFLAEQRNVHGGSKKEVKRGRRGRLAGEWIGP